LVSPFSQLPKPESYDSISNIKEIPDREKRIYGDSEPELGMDHPAGKMFEELCSARKHDDRIEDRAEAANIQKNNGEQGNANRPLFCGNHLGEKNTPINL
jgi:hypothetical protein